MRGKFGEHQTVRSILKSLPRTVHDDVTRAGIGDDYARLLLRDGGSGDTGAAKSVNVAAGVCCDSGYMGLRLDIARLYNSIRIGGYMPWAAVDTIVMPNDDERRMKKLLRKHKRYSRTNSSHFSSMPHVTQIQKIWRLFTPCSWLSKIKKRSNVQNTSH